MNGRKIIASVFILIAVVLGVVFYSRLSFPAGLEHYFDSEYYNQFGPLAICVELLIAGYYLITGNSKTNFTLALFAFTAILDPIFSLFGLFTSIVPNYAMIIFICCALVALFLAFTNTFKLGRISWVGAFLSFVLGSAVELFFNYL
ncbi:hypothetical protein [Muriicola sp. Z0-33]|uniref:hypothetical protein n=1 Tax=Muriicola sp. Z0-33 TaxID=2816957 RepID=UPI002237F767|nr:hypothetical protein [Muriicola sp. Z0-33]MCW5517328.1 hypothetical protein [Muriicola sp. Z0-33]